MHPYWCSLRTPDSGLGKFRDVKIKWHHLSPGLSAILNGREEEKGWTIIVAGHANSVGSGVRSLHAPRSPAKPLTGEQCEKTAPLCSVEKNDRRR